MREVVDGDAAVDALFDLVGQALVGQVHIGEQGVAAHRRDLDGAQDRTERGNLAPGDIAVPGVLAAPALLVVGDGQHLGIAGLRRRERKQLQRSEAAAEVQVLLGGDVLVAEEHHLPVEQGATHLGELCVRETSREVDAFDLGANHRRQRAHGNGLIRRALGDLRDHEGDGSVTMLGGGLHAGFLLTALEPRSRY